MEELTQQDVMDRIGVSRITLHRMRQTNRFPQPDRGGKWSETSIEAWERQTDIVDKVGGMLDCFAGCKAMDAFFGQLATVGARVIRDVRWQLAGRTAIAQRLLWGVPWTPVAFDPESANKCRLIVLKLVKLLEDFERAGLLLSTGDDKDRAAAGKILENIQTTDGFARLRKLADQCAREAALLN